MATALRDYQANAVDSVREAFREGAMAPLLVLPTGGGKTVVFSHIAESAGARGRAVLILVHRRELVRQASSKLADAGVPHGIIAPGNTATRDLVQVASIQTLARRLGDSRYQPPDLIIVDEAHHAVAGQWATVRDFYPEARTLGVTATPQRLDGRGLGVDVGGAFDRLLLGPSVKDLIGQGYLVPARVFAPAAGPELKGIRRLAGDFATGALAAAMNVPTITGDAVEHYATLAPGRPAVAFCASVAHAHAVAEDFRAKGWRAVAASGETHPADRDAAIAGLADGRVQVLCACDLISEGLDVPAISVAILLRPTQSVGLHLQQVGRGLRPAAGKDHLLVLDHAGNTLRLGMPDQEREWTLDGKEAKEKPEIEPSRQCPGCLCIHPPAPECWNCGHVYKAARGARPGVKTKAGVLEEIDAERAEALRTRPLAELVAEAQGLSDFKAIAKAKGYHNRWAIHAYGGAIRAKERAS